MAAGNRQSVDRDESTLVEAAARVLENLAELEPELVHAAILDQRLEPLAATADSTAWPEQAAAMMKALAAASDGEEFDSAHIATAGGEVFAVSEGGLSLVAVTARFVLASLTTYDIRMALRDAARAASGPKAGETSTEAESGVAGDA